MIKISYNIIGIQILIYVEKIIIIHRMHILDGNVVRTLIWILPVFVSCAGGVGVATFNQTLAYLE